MRIARSLALAATTMLSAPAIAAPYQHVLLISVDGMHQLDLNKYIASHPASTLASLAASGVQFSNAYTTAPSDSFPGMIAQVTGATAKTTGLYYDDSYDRSLYAPGNTTCSGNPGTETQFAENLDISLNDITGGGTLGNSLSQIDVNQLPLRKNGDGTCTPVYPHQVIRVNTVFEVAKAAGLHTAWSDKHPAYEILNGPSGTGIDDLYTPEINSNNILGGSGDNTKSFAAVRAYDDVKVAAILNQIDGKTSLGQPSTVPAIFGMNFQSVSVGQKLKSSKDAVDAGLLGGYADASGTPGSALVQQFDYVDGALGRMVAELKAQNLLGSTLIIVSAKHGQAPIDLTKLNKIDDGAVFGNTPGLAFEIADDGLLLWLDPAQQAAKTKAAFLSLKSGMTATGSTPANGLTNVYKGGSSPFHFGDPATDPRAPDFIGVTQLGVVYTTSGSKISEHGGYSSEDRNVPLLVSGAAIKKARVGMVMPNRVYTTQIAPTILSALGLDPAQLQGVQIEGTKVLPGVVQ